MPLAGAVILQVIPDLSAGGAERTTVEVAEALTMAGAKALVVSAGGRLEGELRRAGGELIKLEGIGSKNPFHMWANYRRLDTVVRENKVQLIHARSRAPAWSSLWAARNSKLPFVTTYHGIYKSLGGPKRLYNSVMARGEKVIANSEFTADHIRTQHPWAASRIVVIPRGVDVAKFSADAVSEERRMGLLRDWRIPHEPDTPIILLPARLTGWKGHREAIDAAAILAGRRHLKWRMVFAGDSQGRENYEDELRDLIGSHKLDDRIAMVGHCGDMPAAMALAEIVIAPSNEPEAFGRVAIEAGAMGKAVVGSDLGAQREVIADGETGLLVEPGNASSLATAMITLLESPETRKTLGSAALSRVREKYTKTALQRATLSVYDGLIGRSR